MNGIKFGTFHSYTAWGLLLKNYTIGKPVPRRHTVRIPGRNGLLDTSKALTGEMLYDNRTITANFVMMGAPEEWTEKYSTLLQAIHAKDLTIYIDDDPDYYYTGYVEVGDLKPGKAVAELTITVDAYPYKRERAGTGERL